MATTNVGILTTAGKTLVDRVNGGATKITYTKIVLSSMDNSVLTDNQLKALTNVKPQEVVVNNPQTMLDSSTGETKIRGNGDNTGLATGIYIKTYAVYAKDDAGKEILYGITVSDHPNYLVAYDGLTPQAVTYTYKTKISLTDQINFTNSTDVYVTDQDLKDALAVTVDDYTKLLATKADDSKTVHLADTTNWQKNKITTESGNVLLQITKDNRKNVNSEFLAINGFATIFIESGAIGSPMASRSLRGFINVFAGTGYGVFSPTDANDTRLFTATVSSAGVTWRRTVDDNQDGTVTINGAKFIPADKAKSVQTTDTGSWQKRRITGNDGAVTFAVSSTEDVITKLLEVEAGFTTWYIQVGATNNPENDSMRGYLLKDPAGFGNGVFTANNGHIWRVLLVNNGTVNWRRLPQLNSISDLNDGVRDIYLTKSNLGVSDPISEFWNHFRQRLSWELHADCPAGTDFATFIKSDSVQTGMSIVRDENTYSNWYVIKESVSYAYGFSVNGSHLLKTFIISNGTYSVQSPGMGLQDFKTQLDSKATVQSDSRSIPYYPLVQRAGLTGTPDLNTITTNGIYGFSGLHFVNGPTALVSGTSYGYLTVFNISGVIFQEIKVLISNTPQHYKRAYGGSPIIWGKWTTETLSSAN